MPCTIWYAWKALNVFFRLRVLLMLSVCCTNHTDILSFLLFTLSLRTSNMSRNVAKSTYKPIVLGKPNDVDVRDPFTGLPVRTDAQDRALVDEEIDEQPLHPHAEALEQVYDEDDNLVELVDDCGYQCTRPVSSSCR
jgi:hypothetical protein